MPRYAAAVAADPSLVDAHYSQAVLLHQGQQYAQAAASLRRAVALDGNDAQVMAAAVCTNSLTSTCTTVSFTMSFTLTTTMSTTVHCEIYRELHSKHHCEHHR